MSNNILLLSKSQDIMIQRNLVYDKVITIESLYH